MGFPRFFVICSVNYAMFWFVSYSFQIQMCGIFGTAIKCITMMNMLGKYYTHGSTKQNTKYGLCHVI